VVVHRASRGQSLVEKILVKSIGTIQVKQLTYEAFAARLYLDVYNR